MEAYNLGDVDTCQLVPGVGRLDRNEVGHLGQVIDNDPNGITSLA